MTRRSSLAILFIAAGLVLPQQAHADAAGEALVRDALNGISSVAGWSASASIVRSEGGKVIVEGLSIADAAGAFELQAKAIELEGLSGRGGGYFATGVSVQDMNTSYDLASLVAIDTADKAKTAFATKAEVETLKAVDLFLPGRVRSGPARAGFFSGFLGFYSYLAEVEAASLQMPRIVFEQAVRLPDLDKVQTTRTVYNDSRITDWTDGVVARYDIGAIEIDVSGGPTDDYSMSAEGAFLEHFDIAHNSHVLDPEKYVGGRGDGVWKPALKRAEYRGFRVSTKDANVTIARLALSGFDMRQPERPFLDALESIVASSLAGEEPDDEEVAEMFRELVPGIFSAFRLGEFVMEDLKAEPVVSSDPESGTLDELRITGFSGQGIERFLIAGLSATGPDVQFSLGRMEFDDIGFPEWESFADIMEAAAKIEENPDNSEIAADMARNIMDLYPTAERFLMTGLSGNAPGKPPVKVEEIRVDVTRRALGFMIGGHGAMTGLVIPAVYFDEGGGPNPLALMNYDRLAMDLDFRSDWNEAAAELDYVLNMRAEDIGDLTLAYSFSGLTEPVLEQLFEDAFALGASGGEDIEKIIAMFSDIGFRGFTFSFTDRSIVGRSLALAAAQQGSEAQIYRDQLKAALPFFLSAMPPGDFRNEVIAAAQGALDGGKVTTFSLAPARAILVPEIIAAGMQNPLALIDLLGAGVTSAPAN
jgi:hypothetical protein